MKQAILDLIKLNGEVKVSQIMEELGVSRQYIHRVLSEMQLEGLVEKLGTAPLTYYRLKQVSDLSTDAIAISAERATFLKEHFLWISEIGERFDGLDAMIRWCRRQKLPVEKIIDEFILARTKYLKYFDKNGLISGLDKIKNTVGFQAIGLDELYYQDFYAIERFGKTKLGNLLHYAKQGQSRTLIQEIADQIKPTLMQLIASSKIEAVGFIPPTIQRDVQFMSVLESRLKLPLPQVHLVKVKGEIVVPQKALSKLEDRIQNARSSIMIAERKQFERILLMDDAVGSGATINETSIKLKARGTAKIIIGYAITGSYKGFDVIQEA